MGRQSGSALVHADAFSAGMLAIESSRREHMFSISGIACPPTGMRGE